MLIDIIVFVLLLLALWKGLRKGLIVAVFSFLAFIVGLAAALKLSALAAEYIGRSVSVSQRWLPVLAFLAVFLVVVLLVRLGAKVLEKATEMMMLGWANRLGGVLFFALVYLFIFSIILFYATQLQVIKPSTSETSATYPFLYPYAPKVMEVMGAILPFFKNMFGELLHFFGNVSNNPHPA
jgi:membrane protein required for colicin V production